MSRNLDKTHYLSVSSRAGPTAHNGVRDGGELVGDPVVYPGPGRCASVRANDNAVRVLQGDQSCSGAQLQISLNFMIQLKNFCAFPVASVLFKTLKFLCTLPRRRYFLCSVIKEMWMRYRTHQLRNNMKCLKFLPEMDGLFLCGPCVVKLSR